MGQPDQRRLSATAKIRRVGWDENLVFCSRDYSLLKSMKRSFVCTWHSPNTLPTMVHSQAFHAYNLTISHREASPIHSSGKRRVALWVRLSSGTFNFNLHSLSSVNKYLQLYLLLLLYICGILRVQYIGQFDLFIVYI